MRVSRSILAHESITARNGMVIAQHPLGAQAGYNVLAQGGNAVDVAVTTAFVMGVVQPLMNGIGGGGQMVIRMGDGSVGAVDYGMRASGDASDDMYELIEGQEPLGPATLRVSSRYNWPLVEDNAHLDGFRSVAVPGTVAGLGAALARWGTMDLSDSVAPAIKLAEEGFPIGAHFALSLLAGRSKFLKYAGAGKIFYPGGQPLAASERLVQNDYAATLRLIAEDGARAFYTGEPAQLIAEDAQRHGALLSYNDFADYRPAISDSVISTSYRDTEVLAVPGPGAGPTLIEILNILNQFDLHMLNPGSATTIHTIIEAIKLGAVDRFTFLGDCAPDGGPVGALMDPEYATVRARQIGRVASDAGPGDPWDHLGTPPPDGFPAPSGLGPDYGTTHLTVTDADENAVSLTQTLHGYSGIVTPGVGAMMNNGMGWFYPGPGTVNSVRRYGSGLHNMVPVILTREGMLRAALGSSGGRRIWTAVLQTIINLVDFAMPIQDAIQAPRIHVETDEVLIDGRYPLNVRTELTRMGHSLITTTPRHNLVPFSEPNGILRGDSGFESGVYPVSKPTTAIGYEDGDKVIDPESPMDDHPDLANDLMP